MAHGLQHLHAAWQVEKAVTNDDESRASCLQTFSTVVLSQRDVVVFNLLQFLQFGWSHLETPQTIWFHQVILLRFGQDYDPDCELMDDVLLAISDIVKAVL